MTKIPSRINGKHNPEYRRQHYLKNRQKYLEQTKKWHKANPEAVKEINRRAVEKYKLKYPERAKANYLAKYHIPLDGRCCEICGSTEDLHRHHDDYSKPLEVIIMCKECHDKTHGELRKCQVMQRR